MRRIIRGLGLYYVNTIVDIGNIVSLRSGCSVGCFDADKISGSILTLGIGRENEPYQGIGRGDINISGLPVFRDEIGGFGTPTSDNERTKISLETKQLLITVHLFELQIDIDEIITLFKNLLSKYAKAQNIRVEIFSSKI